MRGGAQQRTVWRKSQRSSDEPELTLIFREITPRERSGINLLTFHHDLLLLESSPPILSADQLSSLVTSAINLLAQITTNCRLRRVPCHTMSCHVMSCSGSPFPVVGHDRFA